MGFNAKDMVDHIKNDAGKDVAARAMLAALKRSLPELNINSLGYSSAREQIEGAIKLGERSLKD